MPTRGGNTAEPTPTGISPSTPLPGAYAVVATKKGVGQAHVRTVLTAGEGLGQMRLFLNHPKHHRHGITIGITEACAPSPLGEE